MPKLLCYTLPGKGTYPDDNYPGCIAYNCDWEQSLHLAVLGADGRFRPMRNNTGILFAEATYDEGNVRGVTKTLVDPFLLREPCRDSHLAPRSGFVLVCVRRNQNAPDSEHRGCVMVYRSRNLVHYEMQGFLELSAQGREVSEPMLKWDDEQQGYWIWWTEEKGGRCCGFSRDLMTLEHIPDDTVRPGCPERTDPDRLGIFFEGEKELHQSGSIIMGNVIEITDEEEKELLSYFGEIRHVKCVVPDVTIHIGEELNEKSLPRAVCVYSDGSVHEKQVAWNTEAIRAAQKGGPGRYEIGGTIRQKTWTFPIPINFGQDPTLEFRGMSDPCVSLCRGKYILSSSGTQDIHLRVAETPEGTFAAEPITIWRVALEGQKRHGTWAAELHEIDGIPYLFTTVCPGGDWTKVKACILRCHGDPWDTDAWEAPVFCRKMDGSILQEQGISLDMTYFRDAGRDYVMWSDRIIHAETDPILPEPACIYIATVDPAAPWQLTSEPVCLARPAFGWDRYETEVDEGPYLLRSPNGEDLYVTISGSSTNLGDIYNVGLMQSKTGRDLLDPAAWTLLPYPLLTKESVEGEYGPGHNNFVLDRDTGDILMVYHAVPHDEAGRTLYRQPGIRRLHWAKTGLPYLEMTPERDLNPALRDVRVQVIVQ
ncbi:MAG: family 43 glycosylhydrolase [Clostridia bacterium]|nr:family 43 glycosylhydrolase [Clostridia bacterium]